MSIKSVLLPFDKPDKAGHALDLAMNIADMLDAHITGLAVNPPVNVPVFTPEVLPQEMYNLLDQERAKMVETCRNRFEELARANNRDHRCDFVEAELPLADVMAKIACYYDLIIARQEMPQNEDDAWLGAPDNLISRSGIPVLVTPWIGLPETTAKDIVIAWNGSQEAARAARAALPFLQRAEKVSVVTCNSKSDVPAADFATWLSRHGITAVTEREIAPDMQVGDLLLNEISEKGHDMLVMGGYGHWRLRELILGGTTRHILQHMTVPVLFCH